MMSSAAPPVPDARARLAAVETPGSVLVQAPAGSGKTSLLVQRYLRLLSRVDMPERILALTFTRRAAQEMRERVLEALQAARDGRRSDALATTFDLAEKAVRHLELQRVDLASAPARMRIETIDSFNAWLAAQMPIAAGAATGLPILRNARSAYLEAAQRALAYEVDDIFGSAVERVLKLDDQRWRGLVNLIANMLPARDRWLPLLAGRLHAATPLDAAQLREVRRHFDEDLALLVERSLKDAVEALGGELLGALAPLVHGAAMRVEAPSADFAQWRESAAVLRARAADTGRWRALVEVVLTKEGLPRAALNKNSGFPPGSPDKIPMGEILRQLARNESMCNLLHKIRSLPNPRYSDAQWERGRDVAQVLVLAAAELDAVFREQSAVDFTAVSLAALRALGAADAPTDLALRLDYRLQHILVDEFQDTSSAQLELVRLLTQGWQQDDGRSVFCVGDPMQSIYGFRQAEVRAFLELGEEGIGDVRFQVERLQSNFRSAAELVQWTNDTFRHILPAADDRERGAIAFHESSAVRHEMSGTVRHEMSGTVRCQGFSGRVAEARGVAAAIAAELKEWPGSRIAILVRARTHAREVADALRAQSIVFRSVDIEALQDRPVVRDILMLTRSLLHAGDRIAWLALLRAPWAGLPLADLLKLAARPVILEALEDVALVGTLSAPGQQRAQRILEAVRAAVQARSEVSLARLIETTWLHLGGAACLTEADDLAQARSAFRRLRDLETEGLPDPAELELQFENLFADLGVGAQVELMTIHKAKGLEFDMVVVPGLERTVPLGAAPLLLAHEFARLERDGMVIAAKAAVGAERDVLFDYLAGQQRDAAALEAQRLLYVACTRARRRLLLTADVRSPSDEGRGAPARAFKPRSGSLLCALWPTTEPQFALPDTDPVPRIADDTEGAPHGAALRRLPLDWSRPLPADLELAGDPVPPAPERDAWPEFDWAGETARRVGSLVHAELQAIDLARVEAAALRARSPYFRRWLGAHGVPAARLDDAAQRVVDALLAVREDPRGQWILRRGYQDDLREHALSGDWRGQTLRAVFDRSFVDAGVRWVIDYKTSQHSGGAREEFLDREVLRYRPQLERYARLAQRMGPEPVRVGLYFPLMRSWREWSPEMSD